MWPSLLVTTIQPVTRQLAARQQAAQFDYLTRLVRQLPVTSSANADLDAYLAVLDQAVEDRHLDPSEAQALQDAAIALGIGGPALVQAHRDFLTGLAQTAMADGIVSDAELADLTAVARLLGLQDYDATAALEHARRQPSPVDPAPNGNERPLRVGMRVCFTGEMCLDRAELERRATTAGLQVTSAVSSKTDVLVVADATSMSTKARRARQVGTRIIAEQVFLTLLERIEPA
jgi:DNA polymerase-3 subunit epsilon